MRPLEVSPKTFTREEEECLLDGDLRLASLKVGATPWNRLLTLYKQLQKSAMAKFPLKEGLPDEEKGKEEEMEEEDNSFKLCVPGIVTLQSPLHKTFRSTDNGFVESELKKLLAVQRESRLWKMGSLEGRELLTQPEITLEEAGIVDGQHLLLEEMDEMGNCLQSEARAGPESALLPDPFSPSRGLASLSGGHIQDAPGPKGS
ncbi:gametogenetin-binding protein 1-like [Leptonychotes weddellii]|uniref:Gametogenetin-binding protein 1 n=1 Tax=Leptonychotes weddellii TaxID=9713 RepID=A0A7F8QAJ2_LEPWE|nr:gametogenetin-binding protein 1-like [Leptonychotes weddellii]